MLYLVPTPIGNLGDITFRAVEVLKQVDLILAEDTRTTQFLLTHYGIHKPLTPYHQHNEHKVVQHLADQLTAGKTMALLTDAGTPGISDPAFLLVRECIRQGVTVETLPGATAFVPALVTSGYPCDRFIFEGFLPVKKGRQTKLKEMAEQTATAIIYESPYRLVKTLGQMVEFMGAERHAAVCREISKIHEECRRGRMKELHKWYSEHEPKGEIVMIIAGKDYVGRETIQEEEE